MNYRLSGAGPVILFLHGIPTNSRLWDYLVQALQHKFTCLAVDLPGMGESPPLVNNSHDPTHYAQSVEELREQLAISSWHVVGHDAGATVAVHYAARFGERVNRLVLCSPPIFPEFRVPWFFRLIRLPLLGDILAPFVNFAIWHLGIQLTIKRHDHLTGQIISSFRQSFKGYRGVRRLVHIVRWGEPSQVLAQTAALLPSITAPTLILHGRKDGAIPASFATRAAAIIPHAEAHLLDDGHFLPLDCPARLCEYLSPFLEGESGPRGTRLPEGAPTDAGHGRRKISVS